MENLEKLEQTNVVNKSIEDSSFQTITTEDFQLEVDKVKLHNILIQETEYFSKKQLLEQLLAFFNPAEKFTNQELVERLHNLATFLIQPEQSSESSLGDSLVHERANEFIKAKLELFQVSDLPELVFEYFDLNCDATQKMQFIHFLTLKESNPVITDEAVLESQLGQEIHGINPTIFSSSSNLTCPTCDCTFTNKKDYDIHQENVSSIDCDYHEKTNCLELLIRKGTDLSIISYNQALEMCGDICPECFNFYWG